MKDRKKYFKETRNRSAAVRGCAFPRIDVRNASRSLMFHLEERGIQRFTKRQCIGNSQAGLDLWLHRRPSQTSNTAIVQENPLTNPGIFGNVVTYANCKTDHNLSCRAILPSPLLLHQTLLLTWQRRSPPDTSTACIVAVSAKAWKASRVGDWRRWGKSWW